MKKLSLILFCIISANIFSLAQNYPGQDVELLVGKEIRVKEMDESLQKYGYDGFYKDDNLKKKFACCQNYKSKYKDLVNKTFKVLSFEPYSNSIGTNKFKLKIENSETGIIYFDYSPEFEHSFPFEVIGGLNYPEGFLCKHIEETKDKFTDKVTYNSPINEDIILYKVYDKGIESIFMRISVYGSTVNVNKTGVIILLENGEKVEKPNAEIKTEVSKFSKGYSYSTFIKLEEKDIEKLIQSPITDVRLYIYDGVIKNGLKISEYLKCLTKK